MRINQNYPAGAKRRRISRTSGFAERNDQYSKHLIKPTQNDGFYYYGSKKKGRSKVYKLGILFLLLPVIVLLLFGNNFYWQGALSAILGMVLSIIYLSQLLKS